MHPYAKLLTGGAALLATTALVSGSAFAATITDSTNITTAGGTPPKAIKAVTIPRNFVAGTTGSTTVLGPLNFSVTTSASTPYTQATSILLNFTNANITGTPVLSAASIVSGSLTNSGAVVTATMFTDHILISGAGSGAGTWSVINVSGIQFTNAQALATVGTSISVSGSVTVSGVGQTESVTSANLVTSVAGPVPTVTADTTVQASNTSTPPFVNFGGTSKLTAALGTISFASPAGFGIDLATSATLSTLSTTAVVTVTHPVLANAAVVSARVGTSVSHTTVAEFAGGSETFTLSGANVPVAGSTLSIDVVFNGTTQITGGKGGTASVTYAGGGGSTTNYAALDTASGSLADVTLNGLSADVNTAQSSANAFPSYIRIHNTSSTAGVATIVVKNDGTGATIGTYTTASIPAGATLQVGTGQIETALSITPSATTPYELQITGAFTGYVQHLGFDGKSLIDLDGFRAASNP